MHGNWPIDARLKFVFPGTPLTAGSTLDFWWYGATRLPQPVIDSVGGTHAEHPGAAILGTEGAILLPHIGAPALHPVDKFAGRAIPTAPERNHYHEFLDAVLAGRNRMLGGVRLHLRFITEGVLSRTSPSTIRTRR